MGLTNVYMAQLFYGQQQLQPNTVAALRAAVPGLSDADVEAMQAIPHRSFNPDVLQARRAAGRWRGRAAVMRGARLGALLDHTYTDVLHSTSPHPHPIWPQTHATCPPP